MDEEFIRNRITELRLKKGISEYQLSLELGQNRGYIQAISSGRALPSMKQLLAMLLSLSAYAASPRVMTILPAISFDGTTANCRVSVSADRSTDQISAVIQLWNGSTRIARWTDSGTGYLLFSNSATVSKGKTYELTVDVKINGVSKPQVSIEGTCK